MYPSLLNLTDYTVTEHVLFAAGCLLWIVVYLFTLRGAYKLKFIDIPLAIVCGNIVWEFLWSFVFYTDMGALYQWGYRVWFFMDCLIVYNLYRYGHKQLSIPLFKNNSHWLITLGIVAWSPVLYYYIAIYDEPVSHMGAYSGYILNVIISILYIPLFLKFNDRRLFSYPSAWCKAVGNLLISLFCFSHFTDGFLLSLCVLCTVFDVIYLYLLKNHLPGPAYEQMAK